MKEQKQKMNNSIYLSLPIKSLNNVVKFFLQQNVPEFSSDSIGCSYKGNYFDFKVTKSTFSHKLCEEFASTTNDIHINQIEIDQPILLCVIFESAIKCFVLDDLFFSKFAYNFSFQHKSNYYQFHTTYKMISENCECQIHLV